MRPKGLEPPAHCLEGSCSIHLSYGRTLLSHWVPLWRQSCVGTRCEKYNTIRNPVCQEQFEKKFRIFYAAQLQQPHADKAAGKPEGKPGGHIPDMVHAGEHPHHGNEQAMTIMHQPTAG